MILAYAASLSLKVQLIDIKVQKINKFIFKTFGIIIASFQITKKLNRASFF